MFWMNVLKREVQQEMEQYLEKGNDDDGKHEKSSVMKHDPRYFEHSRFTRLLYKPRFFNRDRKRYLQYLEKTFQMFILQQKPFEKRRLNNHDIYGNTYKEATIRFFIPRK